MDTRESSEGTPARASLAWAVVFLAAGGVLLSLAVGINFGAAWGLALAALLCGAGAGACLAVATGDGR